MPKRRVLPLVMLLALLAASCGGGGDKKPSTPTSAPGTTAVIEVTTEPPPTTEPEPETTISRGSPRTPTSQVTTMGPGTARIVGNVTGPEGPITGAIVRVERFVGTVVATADLRTQAGAWQLDSILGGSYRVTVFRPPDLAQTTPDTFFLGADEIKTLTTTLIRLGESTVTASIDPNPPIIGVPALLTVRFGVGSVDAEGRVVVTPRPGIRVQLNLGSGMALESLAIVVADGAGAAAWNIRCLQPGQFPAAILVGNASSSLLLPPCTAAPAPPVAATTTVP